MTNENGDLLGTVIKLLSIYNSSCHIPDIGSGPIRVKIFDELQIIVPNLGVCPRENYVRKTPL